MSQQIGEASFSSTHWFSTNKETHGPETVELIANSWIYILRSARCMGICFKQVKNRNWCLKNMKIFFWVWTM